jgi:hypothetical protein
MSECVVLPVYLENVGTGRVASRVHGWCSGDDRTLCGLDLHVASAERPRVQFSVADPLVTPVNCPRCKEKM